MKGSVAGLFVVASLVAAGHVCAQETARAPGRLEVSLIPGGGTWFVDNDDAPDFGNYGAGAAAAYNFSRIFGVEGEVAGAFGKAGAEQHLRGANDAEHALVHREPRRQLDRTFVPAVRDWRYRRTFGV